MTATWDFEEYSVSVEDDVLRFELSDGTIIGYVSNVESNELITELNNGADPIAEGWEDGVGNTIQIWGWGDHYPQTMEEVYNRIDTLYSVPEDKWVKFFETEEEVLFTYDDANFIDRYGREVEELDYPIITFDESRSYNGTVTDNIYDAIAEAESFLGEKSFNKTKGYEMEM